MKIPESIRAKLAKQKEEAPRVSEQAATSEQKPLSLVEKMKLAASKAVEAKKAAELEEAKRKQNAYEQVAIGTQKEYSELVKEFDKEFNIEVLANEKLDNLPDGKFNSPTKVERMKSPESVIEAIMNLANSFNNQKVVPGVTAKELGENLVYIARNVQGDETVQAMIRDDPSLMGAVVMSLSEVTRRKFFEAADKPKRGKSTADLSSQLGADDGLSELLSGLD